MWLINNNGWENQSVLLYLSDVLNIELDIKGEFDVMLR